ncbi:MAG TPA: hypothetical protein VL326_10290 [Kofleriaceae bacterium]|nr:hypothetical protein [Kofleriaceae bacterium]
MVLGVDEWARQIDGSGHDVGKLDRLASNLELATHHARDIEEIVDELDHQLHLAFDDRVLVPVRIRGIHGDQVQGHDHRCKRVAQLVAEHCEELVLRAAIGKCRALARPQRLRVRAQLGGHGLGAPAALGFGSRALDRNRASGDSMLQELLGTQRCDDEPLVHFPQLARQLRAREPRRVDLPQGAERVFA